MSQWTRRATSCGNCHETFVYRYDLQPEAGDNLVVHTTCPFCKARLNIDLRPYARRKVVAYRGEPPGEPEATSLELPEPVPSRVENPAGE